MKSDCFELFSELFIKAKTQLFQWWPLAGVAYYRTLFTRQFHDGQICGRSEIYNLDKLAFFSLL